MGAIRVVIRQVVPSAREMHLVNLELGPPWRAVWETPGGDVRSLEAPTKELLEKMVRIELAEHEVVFELLGGAPKEL